jgi:hypothetical protein
MDKLDQAIERLRRAVARLEAASAAAPGPGPVRASEAGGVANPQLREIAARVDRALARIDRVLGEGG